MNKESHPTEGQPHMTGASPQLEDGYASLATPIKGGYYLKARKIQESSIAHAPPHVREIWDWLLMRAMFANGESLKRGQVVTSYDDIRDGLSWQVGYRKERYSKWDCEKAMKWLTKEQMITTTKTTRGLVITICNYEYYQNPANYESHGENHKKATRKPQTTDTIGKKDKNENSIHRISFKAFWESYPARNGKKLEPGETFRRYCTLPESDLSPCNQAAINYANSENVRKGIGIKDPKRFLLDGKGVQYWREWIEPEQTNNAKEPLGGLAY